MKEKRPLDLAIISDVHLGTIGCHAEELNRYLKSIDPKVLILNGDILDMWQFKKYYWPKSHMKVIKRIVNFAANGTQVYYLTGNHDEMLRRFSDLKLGQFQLIDKLLLDINGEKAWIFHGDVFDITMRHSKWLGKLGSVGYNFLILLNRTVNFCLSKIGRGKISLSKQIKNSVKKAIRFINDFEQTAIDLAISKNYRYVICGHIHQPIIKKVKTKKGEVMYLNSGDWIENLSSLEYHNSKWELFIYQDSDLTQETEEQIEAELEEAGTLTIDIENGILEENLFQHAHPLRNSRNGKRSHLQSEGTTS